MITDQPELDLSRILVVDDYELNRLYMETMFRNTEFSISMASDGEEALERAHAELPFLILSDVQMPQMDGFELCRQLKASEHTKNAAVVFVTAHHRSSEKVTEGLDIGADDYIFRPFERHELLARVRAVARLKRAEEEARRQTQTIARRNKELELLNELALAVASSFELQEIFAACTQRLSHLLEAEAVAFLLVKSEEQELAIYFSSGAGGLVSATVDFKSQPHSSSTAQSIQALAPGIIASLVGDPANQIQLDAVPITDLITCIPMTSKEEVIGTAVVVNKPGQGLTAEDWVLLNSAAGIVAVGVENARLFNQVQEFNRRLERTVAERTKELAEEKETTEAILASMADGLLVLDADNRILTANAVAESILGFRLSQVRGEPIGAEQLASPLWQCIHDMVSGANLVTSSNPIDIPNPAQLGGLISLQALAARVRADSGAVIGTVIVLHDITAVKEVERIKARFMAGVTHELKTPLSIIRLHANNLQTYYDRLPEQKRNELLAAIQSQATLLEQLVEDILTLTYLDAGEAPSERLPVNLAELVDEVMADLTPLSERKQIELRWSPPRMQMMIVAERGQIKRVLQNLVENAIKYTPAGGFVELRLGATRENRIEIQIIDNGIGIAPEHQALIFDRFYRVDPSHTIPGTGLGLSIVREVVGLHGGSIDVKSAPGQGSTFTVLLPGVQRLPHRDRPA